MYSTLKTRKYYRNVITEEIFFGKCLPMNCSITIESYTKQHLST